MIKQEMIIEHQRVIAENIVEIVLHGDLVDFIKEPGQFVHVKVQNGSAPLLRRPISICDFDKDNKKLTMIYRVEGVGTTLLSEKKKGETVDVLGPLGNGFPIQAAKRGSTALLVGGGIGVPPLYNLSKQLNGNGVNVIHVLGFQSASVSFYEEQFKELGEVHIATIDGSKGIEGFVTDVMEIEGLQFDTLFSCGPISMLKALEKDYSHKSGYFSLEQRMGCGIGACFACVCHTQNDPYGHSYRKVCSDGPVFSIGEVVL